MGPKKKKGKKGKGDKKSKGKSKGKTPTKNRDVEMESITRTQIMECKLDATEQSRTEYRDKARKLLSENELLQNQMSATERDTIEVISYLKKEDIQKDQLIEQLQNQLKNLKQESRKDREALIEDFTYQINTLEKQLSDKKQEAQLMQDELMQIKEFRRKKNEMQHELDEMRDLLFQERKQAREGINGIEHKYFEEKLRLQSEASRQIAELAERAHNEAVTNLDETTRNIYRENVRLTESLSLHMKESEELKKTLADLENTVESLSATQEMNDNITREKVQQVKNQRKSIKEKQERIEALERNLGEIVSNAEQEREKSIRQCDAQLYNSTQDIETLQKALQLKEQELKHIKRLGKRILDQRTETETFFLTALSQVKEEIVANRSQYRKDAETAYHSRMLEAQKGKAPFPRTRTFRKLPNSTNSVYSDLEEAERFDTIDEQHDVGDLTWEQKEKVLRILFADINGQIKGKSKKTPIKVERLDSLPPLDPDQQVVSGSMTRIDEADAIAIQTKISEDKALAIESWSFFMKNFQPEREIIYSETC